MQEILSLGPTYPRASGNRGLLGAVGLTSGEDSSIDTQSSLCARKAPLYPQNQQPEPGPSETPVCGGRGVSLPARLERHSRDKKPSRHIWEGAQTSGGILVQVATKKRQYQEQQPQQAGPQDRTLSLHPHHHMKSRWLTQAGKQGPCTGPRRRVANHQAGS